MNISTHSPRIHYGWVAQFFNTILISITKYSILTAAIPLHYLD